MKTFKPSSNAAPRSCIRMLREVEVFSTFQYKGRIWRKYPTGVRLAVGRSPRSLYQLPETELVS